ncbi:MAG: YbbR family protein [Candidatus Solibacter sp.]|nr:YbbR family protein [Candidatus Solibacter sp.]
MRTLKWIRELIFRNLGWKLLALSAAVIIWALVATEPELSTFATVRLEYKNLPEGLEISSDPVTSVVLELRGPQGELRGVGDTVRPAVVLDMSNVDPGEHTFAIGSGNVKLARTVQLVRSIPAQVRFSFEPRRMHSVPVRARFTGEGMNGYVIDKIVVEPKELEITGPRTRVGRVTTVLTDQIDVSNVTGTSEFRVNVFVDDAFVRFESAPEAAVTVTMKKRDR